MIGGSVDGINMTRNKFQMKEIHYSPRVYSTYTDLN
jgi:hypothetical protein